MPTDDRLTLCLRQALLAEDDVAALAGLRAARRLIAASGTSPHDLVASTTTATDIRRLQAQADEADRKRRRYRDHAAMQEARMAVIAPGCACLSSGRGGDAGLGAAL